MSEAPSNLNATRLCSISYCEAEKQAVKAKLLGCEASLDTSERPQRDLVAQFSELHSLLSHERERQQSERAEDLAFREREIERNNQRFAFQDQEMATLRTQNRIVSDRLGLVEVHIRNAEDLVGEA